MILHIFTIARIITSVQLGLKIHLLELSMRMKFVCRKMTLRPGFSLEIQVEDILLSIVNSKKIPLLSQIFIFCSLSQSRGFPKPCTSPFECIFYIPQMGGYCNRFKFRKSRISGYQETLERGTETQNQKGKDNACGLIFILKINNILKAVSLIHSLQIGGNLHCIIAFQRCHYQGLGRLGGRPPSASSSSSKLNAQRSGHGKSTVHINSVNGNINYETESVATVDIQTESDETIDSDQSAYISTTVSVNKSGRLNYLGRMIQANAVFFEWA